MIILNTGKDYCKTSVIRLASVTENKSQFYRLSTNYSLLVAVAKFWEREVGENKRVFLYE